MRYRYTFFNCFSITSNE